MIGELIAPSDPTKVRCLLQLLFWELRQLRPPVLLPANIVEPGEGGVRDRKTHRWIAYHDTERVDYDAPKIELLDRAGMRLVAWSQPEAPLPMLRELEAGVHAARSATDPMQLGRGELSTAGWLTSLEQRFCGEQAYRHQPLDQAGVMRALADTAGRADVRAGAAFALLASGSHESLPLVRSKLSCNSPPLLIAVSNMLSPGIVGSESLAEARRYLTEDERAALDGFGKRPVRLRVAMGDVPAELEESPATAEARQASRYI